MSKENNKLMVVKSFGRNAKLLIIVIACVVIGTALGYLFSSHFDTSSKTTKIGFEDIGELDTQVAYCTVVNVIEDPRKIFEMEIPFTKSKYIYSYDVVVKAGLDFSDITWSEKSDKVVVKMPELYITDSYIDEDSGKVYHEKESIFSPITLEEEMLARQDLLQTGVDDAVANGLYDNAKKNAEILIEGFIKQHDDLKDKTIEFVWK